MDKTFASFSFGCRVNQAEVQEINRQLSAVSFQYSEKNPDYYIINTCAVTKKAEREARQFIYQIRRKFPKTIIVVTGCAATKWKKEGLKIQNVDYLIDNTDKKNIVSILDKKPHSVIPSPDLIGVEESSNFRNVEDLSTPQLSWVGRDDERTFQTGSKYLSSKRLLVKIQDGCQRFCTYCIVPYLRGKPRSKRIKGIIKEINSSSVIPSDPPAGGSRNLPTSQPLEDRKIPPRVRCASDLVGMTKCETCEAEKQDIKEVILTAINTEAYGIDTGEKFTDLIKAVIEKTQVPRISFGSINPWSIDKEFRALYRKLKTDNRLIHFFHIPLQSGSNKILSLMKRDYTREEFKEKIEAIKKINPFAFIATDVIVGFLEETEKDFADTYNFLKDSPISKFHVFRFSKREATAAFYMSKKLKEPSEKTKKERAKILFELGKKKYQEFLEKHIDKTFPVLFLDKKIGDYQEGLLDNQVPVFVKTSKNLVGEIKKVKIKIFKDERLIGKIVNS